MKHYSIHGARKAKINGVQVLTCTSKMPGPSFSLPAGKACPNSHGSICGNCYAKKGCYAYPTVDNAQTVRYAWVRECMKSETGRAEFVQTMVMAIELSGTKYFRGHDSGDFFNVAYVEAWVEVAKALPKVKFWFPTREYQAKGTAKSLFPVLNPRMDAIRRLASLGNVTVRPSALEIGDSAPVVEGLHAGSAVGNSDAFQCPAYRQNGECKSCRTCWNSKDVAVSYPLH